MSTLIHTLLSNFSDSHKIAIRDSAGVEISYCELIHSAQHYADIVRGYDVDQGDRVIFATGNSIAYVQLLLGAWIAGAICVPMHAQASDRELRHAAKTTAAKLLISDKERPTEFPLKCIPLSVITEHTPSLTPEKKLRIGHQLPSANDVAMILFTSGTTGAPKGVTLTHRNLYANTVAIVDYLRMNHSDYGYTVLPFNYVYGNSVLQTHLFAGATLHLGKAMMFPQKVYEDLCDFPVSGFFGVPSTFSLVLDRSTISEAPPQLRYITQAGGAMDHTSTKRVAKAFPNADIFIMYGQTEASARLSYLPPNMIELKEGSAGIAIPGVTLAITNEQGDFLPANETGEIVAQGDNVMQGYWNDPVASAQTLVNGWLHTGDLGYLDEDGYLFIKGRKSQLIKAGAHRIHPYEIEAVLMELDFVSEAAVIGVPDKQFDNKIVAFLVPVDETIQDTKAVMRHCKSNLPPHKTPRDIIWKNELPKTSSGKIKKHELTI